MAVGWLLLASMFALWWIEAGGLWHASHWDQYVYLADAFNHGQLYLFHHPADAGDMAIVGGRAYVVFGPLPALPLMPLVAFLGPATPDVLVLALTALLGTWAFYRLLRELHPDDRLVPLLGAASLALGSPMHYGSALGNVWLHAQISALTVQCLALWMAARGRAWWSGGFLAAGVLCRPTVTLAAPVAAWLLARGPRPGTRPDAVRAHSPWRIAVALGVPIAAAAAIHGAYNLMRFHHLADAGYHYILMGGEFAARVATWGRFSLHFLGHNLRGWMIGGFVRQDGALMPDPHGTSIWLTIPFLWLVFVPRRWTRLEWLAAANAVVIAIPALLYYNDGWVQFGQRFALDWLALGLLIASFGARRLPHSASIAIAAAGVAMNMWGTTWFAGHFLH
ncbi:MAG TPA: hypothetical protein VFI79_13940 [Gemmatimonadales bacterium]|nr:hypothetical protein [Gemmatimonadales bacterium]